MLNKRPIVLASLLLGCQLAYGQQKKGTLITGSLDNYTRPYIYLSMGNKLDSVPVTGGKFSYQAAYVENAIQLTITDKSRFGKEVYIENSPVEIKGDIKAPKKIIITGGKLQAAVSALNGNRDRLQSELEKLNKDIDAAEKANNAIAQKKLEQQMAKQEKAWYSLHTDFIKNNPDHPESYQILQMLHEQLDYAEMKSLYSQLSPRLKKMDKGYLEKSMEKFKNGAIGQPMINFTQNDISGTPVSFSAFKGKYVLVDFWASWCGPCRAENPNVLKAYNKYSAKGFTVVGISLDDNADKWKKAVADDKMPWAQLSSLNGRKNEVSTYYNINGIPANFLVDPNGIIIAKDLRGYQLEAKLEEVMKL